jgi:hypothetical protein
LLKMNHMSLKIPYKIYVNILNSHIMLYQILVLLITHKI